MDFFPNSPVIGTSNPIAPPVTLVAVDGVDGGMREMRGTVNFGYPYEGPPTCVHGGVIAEVFDEVLGATNIVAGNPGMTGTLTIKYRKPTPLLTDLRIEARCLGWSGRKIRTWGGMYNGDRSRKQTLVNFGFRLPSALDNRPQSMEEFNQITGQTLVVDGGWSVVSEGPDN